MSITAYTSSDLRIVVLGSSGVGKSALVMQLIRGVFVETYDPTLEDSFIKQFPLPSGGPPLTVEILDTAGTDQFEAMRDMYIGSGDAFVVVYGVDSKASFNEVVHLIERIKRLKRRAPIVIVGNKSDLPSKLKRVPYEQASFLAHKEHCSFVEASARKNLHVKEAFEVAVRQATEKNLFKAEGKRDLQWERGQSKRKSKDCIIQ